MGAAALPADIRSREGDCAFFALSQYRPAINPRSLAGHLIAIRNHTRTAHGIELPKFDYLSVDEFKTPTRLPFGGGVENKGFTGGLPICVPRLRRLGIAARHHKRHPKKCDVFHIVVKSNPKSPSPQLIKSMKT